jgi:hypothetical protein
MSLTRRYVLASLASVAVLATTTGAPALVNAAHVGGSDQSTHHIR